MFYRCAPLLLLTAGPLGCGCPRSPCQDGLRPLDLTSNHPPDVVVELVLDGNIDPTWSALRNGIRFTDADGEPVSYDLELADAGPRARLTPREPLADGWYTVTALERSDLAKHHTDERCGPPRSRTTHFAVGSALELRSVDWFDDAVYLVFSEPVLLDDMARVQLSSKPVLGASVDGSSMVLTTEGADRSEIVIDDLHAVAGSTLSGVFGPYELDSRLDMMGVPPCLGW